MTATQLRTKRLRMGIKAVHVAGKLVLSRSVFCRKEKGVLDFTNIELAMYRQVLEGR